MSYFGFRSQNEIIGILCNEVKTIIVKKVQDTNLYSVMTDTTPDIFQKDRLVVCVRINNGGMVMERLNIGNKWR